MRSCRTHKSAGPAVLPRLLRELAAERGASESFPRPGGRASPSLNRRRSKEVPLLHRLSSRPAIVPGGGLGRKRLLTRGACGRASNPCRRGRGVFLNLLIAIGLALISGCSEQPDSEPRDDTWVVPASPGEEKLAPQLPDRVLVAPPVIPVSVPVIENEVASGYALAFTDRSPPAAPPEIATENELRRLKSLRKRLHAPWGVQ